MKLIKKISKITLSLSLILPGLININFVNAASDFASGDGTASKPYVISSAKELDNVRKYCGKKYKGTYFKISTKAKKIDMSSIKNFEPICDLSNGNNEEEVFKNAFYGNFDGNDIEIDNLKINTSKISGGLFGATNSANISNIVIGKNSSITVHGFTDKTGVGPAGSIVGEAWNTTLRNVTNNAAVKTDRGHAGGIVGRLIMNSTINSATNKGSVSAGKDNNDRSIVGGIVGYASDNVTIDSTINEGKITGDASYVGGIVGTIQGYTDNRLKEGISYIRNATNSGSVSAGKSNDGYSIIGGIAGNSSTTSIFNVTNKGNITGDASYVGGIVGNFNGKDNTISLLSVAYNEGKINAGKGNNDYSKAGGIIGNGNFLSIQNVFNSAEIYGAGSSVGGIAGHLQDNVKTLNIFNINQKITSSANYGLLIGYANNSTLNNSYTLKGNNSLNGVGKYEENVKIENMKGLTKDQLKDKNNFVGFDFDNTWKMNSDYPILKGTNNAPEITTGFDEKDKNVESGITIKYNDTKINVEAFLYNDGRTYVNLYDFCKTSNICSVSNSKSDENVYYIDKNVEATGNKITSEVKEELKYTYRVMHTKGEKVYYPYIMIGNDKNAENNRIIRDNVTNQTADVPSCPSDIKDYKCDENHFYVPVRFLVQSMGLSVEWDDSNKTVNIKNNIIETFLSKYEVVTTTKDNCSDKNCIVEKNGSYTKVKSGKTYYLNVLNKETKERMDYYKFYSFYNNAKNIGSNDNPKFKAGVFEINKNSITVNRPTEFDTAANRNIAEIIVYEIKKSDEGYKESDYNIGGYPIIFNNVFSCTNCK